MTKLTAPATITNETPIEVQFSSDQRLSGRVRLTHGERSLSFILEREGRDPVVGDKARVRGKNGSFQITEWGRVEVGTELVVRFEGAKAWIKVVE